MEVVLQSSNGKALIVESQDLPVLSRLVWHVQMHKGKPVATARIGKRNIQLHHLVLGPQPGPNTCIMSVDGNFCRAVPANLAWVSKSVPMHRKKTTRGGGVGPFSQYRGVVWDHRQPGWRASLAIDRRPLRLGHWATEREAAEAYDTAARKHFGGWARVNFPSPDDPLPDGTVFPAVAGPLRAKDGRVLSLDPEDLPLIARFPWSLGPSGYETLVGPLRVPLHVLILGIKPFRVAELLFRDGDPTNFRKGNLSWRQAPCLHAQRRGAVRGGKVPYIGLQTTTSGRFAASIRTCKKALCLGTFDDPLEAARAYDRAALEIFGPEAVLNFPLALVPARQSIGEHDLEGVPLPS